MDRTIPGITELPIAAPGMRIGLFGGSFNPVHDGHRLVALQCLKRLALDAVWILVSPGNPLKDLTELAPLSERVATTRALMAHPQIEITGFEAAHDFHFSFDTLQFLTRTHPGVHFVWILGADNLRDFDRWERWEDIAHMLPIAVYARPGAGGGVIGSKAATRLKSFRLPEAAAPELAGRAAPAWVYLHGITSPLSSTALRQKRGRAR